MNEGRYKNKHYWRVEGNLAEMSLTAHISLLSVAMHEQ